MRLKSEDVPAALAVWVVIGFLLYIFIMSLLPAEDCAPDDPVCAIAGALNTPR